MNKETLKSLAHNLLFDMKDEEYETLSKEFDIILKQMKLIESIPNIEKVKPMFYPFPLEDVEMREDEVTERISTEDLLQNASSYEYDMIKVPKVVE